MNGDKYDSYHQVFSLKALYILKEESLIYENTFNKSINFLKNYLMDDSGNVYLTPKKDIIDMQGATEALSFFQLINDEEMINKIIKQIELNLKKNNKYIQRNWTKYILPIKSRTIFTRQGELRLLLCMINNEV